MDVYGRTGYAKTIRAHQIEVRHAGEGDSHISNAAAIPAPYDDPLHYLAAVIRGDVSEDDDLSSLKTNVIVSEILDAARQSAQSGKTVKLPLKD
jgi:predicted dehydrogenase